ncbi:hypothetical protein GCM10009128_26280 [Psychrosphaera haliotis]|uniref:hypothetical protein n=1 Tax=Psychrosphaera haliotis TaxID=555083 RepID=UPI0031DD6C2B
MEDLTTSKRVATFLSKSSVENLCLPPRATKALNLLNINNALDAVRIVNSDFCAYNNVGVKTVNESWITIRRLLLRLEKMKGKELEEAFERREDIFPKFQGDFVKEIVDLIEQYFKYKKGRFRLRDRNIFFYRLGIYGKDIYTLSRLSKKFQLSRERIRVIVNNDTNQLLELLTGKSKNKRIRLNQAVINAFAKLVKQYTANENSNNTKSSAQIKPISYGRLPNHELQITLFFIETLTS